MSLDPTELFAHLLWVLSGLVGLVVVKAAILMGVLRGLGVRRAASIETSSLLASGGEFGFVILAAAVAAGALAPEPATLIASIAGLSMLLIPLLDAAGRSVAARSGAAEPEPEDEDHYSELQGHVIVAGFGRVGQTIAHILRTEETEFVALDRDPGRVAFCRNQGWKVFLGDAARPEILEQAGAHGAAMFIITVDDAESAERMVPGDAAVAERRTDSRARTRHRPRRPAHFGRRDLRDSRSHRGRAPARRARARGVRLQR